MPDSFIPYGPDPVTAGRRSTSVTLPSSTRDGVTTTFHRDEVIAYPDRRIVTYKGAVGTFRTLGRAGTVGQKIFAIHNATGSSVLVDVKSLNVSMYDTAIKAATVPPPIIRAWRFTAVPTNGTVLTKRGDDTSETSNASVTIWGDASSDGTGSATALTVTLPAAQFISQAPGLRMITAAGFETLREQGMLQYTGPITLRALEGIAVFLDYTVATSNPITDMWQVDAVWEEHTVF